MLGRISIADTLTRARSIHVVVSATGRSSFIPLADFQSASDRELYAARIDLAVAH
jgi:hypothetical protein